MIVRNICLAAACAAAVAFPTGASAMANPASVFCGAMGGHSVSAKLASGDEIGLCYLTEYKIVEEWTLFRMFKGRVPSRANNPFLHG